MIFVIFVTYLDVDKSGLICLDQLQDALSENTILVSIMHVNNEIGVIQDLPGIGRITRDRGVLFHVDGVQAAGKVPIDVDAANIDLMSFSAHKLYGPKGAGALYIRKRPRVRIKPQLHGGSQQGGLRSGTLATHQIVGMGDAFRLAREEYASELSRIKQLRQRFLAGLASIDAMFLNGGCDNTVANNMNICFQCVDAESLMLELSGLAVSNGSACNSIVTESSYVLKALGLSDLDALSSIRVSLGRYTTEQDIDKAVVSINNAVMRLRALSPLWREGECA